MALPARLPRVPMRTSLGFVFSMLERSITDSLSVRQFGESEILQVLAFFDTDPPECAFCGSTNVERWDHLIPVSLGGETVLGNMVLACRKCDDSKGQRPFEQWMESSVPGSPASRGVADRQLKRKRIKDYQASFGYAVRPLPTRLVAGEQARLDEIRRKAREVRSELNQLIIDFRKRTTLQTDVVLDADPSL